MVVSIFGGLQSEQQTEMKSARERESGGGREREINETKP